MLSASGYRPGKVKIVLFSLLAMVLGLLHPLLFTYQTLFLLWLPCVYVIASALLYAGGGWIPAGILLGAGAVFSFLWLDARLALALLPVTVLPAFLIVRGIQKREPFFAQMRTALVASVGGALLTLFAVILFFGGDAVAQFMDLVRSILDEIMPSMYQIYQPVFEAQGVTLSYEDFLSTYAQVLATIQTVYATNLPGALLVDAALTALIAVLWGNWVTARHGDATVESFKGLADWHMPSDMVIGLLIAFAASAILSNLNLNGTNIAWATVCSVVYLAFTVQLLSAMDRRMKARGRTRGGRTAIAILLFTVINILSILKLPALLIGAGLAIFGKNGVIDQRRRDSDKT